MQPELLLTHAFRKIDSQLPKRLSKCQTGFGSFYEMFQQMKELYLYLPLSRSMPFSNNHQCKR